MAGAVGAKRMAVEMAASGSSTLAKSARVATVLGTMSIPNPLDAANTKAALDAFHDAGHEDLDTALMYQGGKAEETLGEVGVKPRFRIAVKANPWYKDGKTFDNPVGGLRADSVKEQLRKSLASLRIPSADLFYLHAPDHQTPLEETLCAVHELGEEGLFLEWGLSNYPAWEAMHIWHTCRSKGWRTPSVYQGMYNVVTREVERELIPALRALGMRFYAYNPLAGGILTGKHQFDAPPESGRFSSKTVWGGRYRDRFWHKPTFEALKVLQEKCQANGTTLVSASLRWLYHHSALRGEHGDAVIVCGSSLEQVKENIEASVNNEPLPEDLVECFNEAWRAAKPQCPQYFR